MNDEFRKYKAQCDAAREGNTPLELDFVEMTIEGIKRYHQISFAELGIGFESDGINIGLEDNTEEDVAFLELSEEEQAEYNKHKAERNKRVTEKFNSMKNKQVSEQVRGKAHIDEEWQKELLEDLEMEFNERNRGGYGR